MVHTAPLSFIVRSLAAATLCATLAFSSAAVRGAGEPRVNDFTNPHVLTISDGGDVNTLNPHLGHFAAVANLSEMTMAWLVKWDEHNQPYPELATAVPTKTNGGVSADGRTITYHLRQDARWSDGVAFDADDVVFSVAVVNNPKNNEAGRFDQIAIVEAPDKYTVVFHLKKPYSPAMVSFFSSCCANPSLLPKHLLAQYPTINDVAYNDLPVGIGPFKFERWDKGKQVVLAANGTYFRGRPKLDRIVYRVIPDRTALLGEMQAHRVDLWFQFSGAYLAQISALPAYGVIRQPSYAYNHLDFNLTHPVVADARVRRALRLALDRRGLVASVEHGVGIVQDSTTPASAPYVVDVGATPYDPKRAISLLDGAGWALGADGIRHKNGQRLVLDAASRSGSPEIDAQLERIRSDWEKVGVKLVVHHYPPTKMFAPAQRGGVVYGNTWDVTTFAWAADPIGDFSGTYGCNQFPPAGENNVRWCNHTADRAMDALLGHYDLAERRADLAVFMREFVKDTPSIVTSLRVDLFAYNRDLKNYHPNTVTPFDNMMEVDI